MQEIGRAGRDRKPSIALALISEPTGWLDPEDKQRQQFFENKLRSQYQSAQQLVKKLPAQGEVNAVARQFPDAAIALSILHSAKNLEWQTPFDYVIANSQHLQFPTQLNATQQMSSYLYTKQCRWQFLLSAFGFSKEAVNMRCGHCDRCTCQN